MAPLLGQRPIPHPLAVPTDSSDPDPAIHTSAVHTFQVQILPGSPRPGSIIVDAVASVTTLDSVPGLTLSLAALQRDPMGKIGQAFLSTYGISGVQVVMAAAPQTAQPPIPAPPSSMMPVRHHTPKHYKHHWPSTQSTTAAG